MQESLVEYLYAAGVRPELGLAVEYLALNKEHRLYLRWLRDLAELVKL